MERIFIKKNLNYAANSGFTVNELVIVITMITILGIIAISNFTLFIKRSEVNNGTQEFANVLKLAQSKTLSSENNSQYGVYINTSSDPDQYILFKGATYATRDTLADQTYSLPKSTEFFTITLGGGNEVDFNRLDGTSQQSGNVTVRSKNDTSQTKTVYIDNSGTIGFTAVSAPSDSARVKDSRHLHFNYSRIIDTLTESITLNFNNGEVIQTFPINVFLVATQIEWSQTISVGGVDQTVKVRTHNLNNPDTQFSIHRDRRFNDKSLKITISGESNILAEYSADGSSTTYTSIYVSSFQLQ